MIRVNFHKFLKPYVNNKSFIEIEVNTYLDLMRACSGLFPEFHELLKKCANRKNRHEEIALIVDGKALTQEEILFHINEKSHITIVPIIYGSGKIGTYIGIAIAAIVLVVVAWYALPALVGGGAIAAGGVAGGAAGAAATGAGIAAGGVAGGVAAGAISISSLAVLALGIAFNLVLMLLAPKISTPKNAEASDSGQRRNNDIFDGLQNTSTIGPLLLNYGLTRIAGQLTSGYIKTINHGKDDIVKVGDTFIK